MASEQRRSIVQEYAGQRYDDALRVAGTIPGVMVKCGKTGWFRADDSDDASKQPCIIPSRS